MAIEVDYKTIQPSASPTELYAFYHVTTMCHKLLNTIRLRDGIITILFQSLGDHNAI